MALSITVGSVSITINALAAADPVITHPSNPASTYASFVETVEKSGLAKIVFEAFPAVAQFNSHNTTRVKWPPQYGTTEKPWGQPADPVTGYRERKCEDVGTSHRWTDAVRNAATGRKSYLDQLAEWSFAIATGIKRALEDNFQTGHVTLVGGVAVVTANITANSEVYLTHRGTAAPTDGVLSAGSFVLGTPGTFAITSSLPGDVSPISWMVVG